MMGYLYNKALYNDKKLISLSHNNMMNLTDVMSSSYCMDLFI